MTMATSDSKKNAATQSGGRVSKPVGKSQYMDKPARPARPTRLPSLQGLQDQLQPVRPPLDLLLPEPLLKPNLKLLPKLKKYPVISPYTAIKTGPKLSTRGLQDTATAI